MSSTHQRILAVLDLIDKTYKESNYAGVDKLLENVDFSNMLIEEIIAYTRTTFSTRNKLPHWKLAVEKADRELILRGETRERVDKLLRGLQNV